MGFKIVISDPKTRKAYQKDVEKETSGLLGKKIGETFSGNLIGLQGYELQITGGSDNDGFPMRADVEGTARKKILLSSPPGFHPKKKGQRKRKSVRGNTISLDISQINVKVVKYGEKSLDEIFGKVEKKEEETKPEKGKETEEKEVKEKSEKPKTEEKKEEESQVKNPEEKMGVKEIS